MDTKEIIFSLYRNEILEDARLAIAFASSRERNLGYEHTIMLEDDDEVTSKLVALVLGKLRHGLGGFASRIEEKEEVIEVSIGCRSEFAERVEKEVQPLLHSAAVGYLISAWQRVTSPDEAVKAEEFGDSQLSALISVLRESPPKICRRPLFPF